MIITRKQYMDGEATHEEYYGQFVTPEITDVVLRIVGKAAILASTDPHLNDIPLRVWDELSGFPGMKRSPMPISRKKMDEAGDYLTFAGAVCIAKEAARRWRAQQAARPVK